MNDIYEQLKALRLPGMAERWQMMLDTHSIDKLTPSECLSLLLQAEKDQRTTRRTARLIKNAQFRYQTTVDEILFDTEKGRNKELLMQLALCEYIRQGTSILITGPSGVGKSFISSALGYQACLAGLHVRYFNMQKLLERIQLARMEGTIANFFDKMAALDLLIIDDFGMKVLDGQQLLDFMEVIEDRHARRSTIISSQLPISAWYDIMAKNATIADAILDRIVKTSYKIELNGDSYRK